jgi:hypothetical protein
MSHEPADHLLKQLLRTEKQQLHVAEQELEVLRRIEHDLHPPLPRSFRLTQENIMAILGIIPGSTGTFTVTPLDAAGAPFTGPLPAGYAPVWTSSDTVNAPVVLTPNPAGVVDGLNASITVPAAFAPAPGTDFNLTIANPDGSGATVFPIPFDAVPPPPPPPLLPAAFGLTQNT